MNTSKTSSSSAALAASERSGEAANAAGAPPSAPGRSFTILKWSLVRIVVVSTPSISSRSSTRPIQPNGAGAVGALLRREGLYSRTWPLGDSSASRASSTPSQPRSVAQVVVSPLVKENRELQAANARLTKKLKNAELIIEVQKKWLRCWATRFPTSRSTRRTDERRFGVG